ncbi:hypothetical protein EVAR_3600_1 [Eumeta japonica]|uniref:Uncharacterized protein n=1 Tax=Eumeta variegata TaxID=151549 RepID=A0A4C1SVN6_EUMVA|nr:hypothetical protein EVAR_3600_1 [Eumeta japonica]
MLEVLSDRVTGWYGREPSSNAALRQAVRVQRRQRHAELYTKIDADRTARSTALYRIKEGPAAPVPQPPERPPTGLACARCAPVSRVSTTAR